MRLCGGYNILMAGRPAGRVDILPEPDVINLPLWSRRFNFTEFCMEAVVELLEQYLQSDKK